MKHTKGLSSARRKDALYILPKTKPKIQNRLLPAIEHIKGSSEEISDNNLEGREIEEFIIPSFIIDVYSRFEIFLGKTGRTKNLTQASNLIDELGKRSEVQNEQLNRKAVDKFHIQQMELPSKTLEQVAFITRRKIEEFMLIVMDKSTQEGLFYQPLQANIKQFKTAVTLLTG